MISKICAKRTDLEDSCDVVTDVLIEHSRYSAHATPLGTGSCTTSMTGILGEIDGGPQAGSHCDQVCSAAGGDVRRSQVGD